MRFSLVAVFEPVAIKKMFDSIPTFLKVVLAGTLSPTHRTIKSVSLSTELSMGALRVFLAKWRRVPKRGEDLGKG